jgi:hypothetical protein
MIKKLDEQSKLISHFCFGIKKNSLVKAMVEINLVVD